MRTEVGTVGGAPGGGARTAGVDRQQQVVERFWTAPLASAARRDPSLRAENARPVGADEEVPDR